MSFNFSELQQKADRVLHNADEFVRRYVQFALAPAQDISVQYYDQNGNLQTTTFPNRQKLVNQFFNDINSTMMKTYYVDSNGGNDDLDGTSQQRPFKTFRKALDSIPVGGAGIVYLKAGGVYPTSETNTFQEFDVINKTILITRYGNGANPKLLGKTKVENGARRTDLIRLSNSSLHFYDVDIDTELGDTNLPVVSHSTLFGGSHFRGGYSSLMFLAVNYDIYININLPALISTSFHTSLFSITLHSPGTKNVYVFRANAADLSNTEPFLSRGGGLIGLLIGSRISMSPAPPQGEQRWVHGVVRHSSGIPLNVLSNIPL